MRFYVIRLKYVLILLSVILAAVIVCMRAGQAVTTFFANGREIPIYCVERSDNKIALTFDCAWNDDDIDEIIDTLKQYDAKATFFVTGKWAEKYPSSLNKLYRNGFEIGIHSYNHDNYTKMSSEEILKDMDRCDEILKKSIGFKPSLARVPSGAYDDNAVRTIENSGRYCIQWSVDGIDYTETTADEIFSRATANTRSGDIILLHNGTKLTADVLPRILEELGREYETVNVSQLIYSDNYKIDHTGRQISNDVF